MTTQVFVSRFLLHTELQLITETLALKTERNMRDSLTLPKVHTSQVLLEANTHYLPLTLRSESLLFKTAFSMDKEDIR